MPPKVLSLLPSTYTPIGTVRENAAYEHIISYMKTKIMRLISLIQYKTIKH